MVWLKIPGLVATKTAGSVPKVSRENIQFWLPERRLDMSPGVLFNKCWFCHHKLVRRWLTGCPTWPVTNLDLQFAEIITAILIISWQLASLIMMQTKWQTFRELGRCDFFVH